MDKKYVAYAGSYTHESSKGIHIYDCDVAKGRITEREEVAIDNPSFIAFSHDKNFLYSICDQGVSAYAVLEDGSLELMNVASMIIRLRKTYILLFYSISKGFSILVRYIFA